MKKKCLEHINFNEVIVSNFNFDRDQNLIFSFKDSSKNLIEIIFSETIFFSFKQIGNICEIYELTEKTSLLNEALLREYSVRPIPENNFREYHMIDDNQNIAVKIVCEKLLQI